MTTPQRPTVSIRFSAAEIAARVDVMAKELAQQLPPDTLVVSVLKGSFVFAADLIRALSLAGADWSMDFLTLSSYGTSTQTSGSVKVVRDIVDDVRGRDVLLVDDILESGFTLSFAKEMMMKEHARIASGSAPCSTSRTSAAPSSSPISPASRRATNSWSATGWTGRTAFAACPTSAWSKKPPEAAFSPTSTEPVPGNRKRRCNPLSDCNVEQAAEGALPQLSAERLDPPLPPAAAGLS